MKIIDILKRVFTWWNGQTIGTWFYTLLKGEKVGSDQYGNIYYVDQFDIPKAQRRWVIYNGESEASRIPPSWHAWLHHIVNKIPEDNNINVKAFEQSHRPNLTGSQYAYTPRGSLINKQLHGREKATGDYEAWTPYNGDK